MLSTNFAPLAQAFGFTLAHSLWQIALIWLVFKLLEWRLNTRHQAVYLLSLAAMLASTGWAITTFLHEWARLKPVEIVFSPSENEAVVASSGFVPDGTTTSLNLWESAQIWLESNAAPIGWAWLACVGLLWLRLMGGWYLAQRLRRRDVSPAVETLQILCNDWAKRLSINPHIQLLESPHISEPLTLGFWKPVVLFPVGMLLQLSPAQVETLLVHELAHIRRHDYFINLFQLALEVCFFYHPLFWLLSREARSRREFCCDELVLKHTSDPILYAKTLTDLQLSLLQPSTTFVMNATGKSRFTERILHIVGISPKRTVRPNWLIVMMLPALLALCSWWPSNSQTASGGTTDLENITVSDSTPPRKSPDPTAIAMPKNNAQPAPKKDLGNVTDELSKKMEAERISINVEPARPENVAMEVVKMNIFYIGVDNPLRIAAAGVPANELRVQLIGKGSIEGDNGNYVVRVMESGEVKVRVSRQVGNDLKFVVDQKYRVKRIPDPAPRLDRVYRSGPITLEEMQQSKGINPMLENFDFDVLCEVVGFEITYLPLEEDPFTRQNQGGEWNSGALEWIKKAKPGDTYFFDDIKVKCPGDAAPRNLGGLAFKIKKPE
ncbi:MAG: M48 family metalloprotease [Phycisphaerae bacterium]|nr:M48 family metalloprotease [Saprospiraceae bacterium]